MLDRDAATLSDPRLVAHICADEPPENAAIASRCYLAQARRGRCRCRPMLPDDLRAVPFGAEPSTHVDDGARSVAESPVDEHGRSYRLDPLQTGMSIPELRWCVHDRDGHAPRTPLSVREVIGRLQSYEPVCTATRRAIESHDDDDRVSTTVLRGELSRLLRSPIVLNRRLRESVLGAVERQGLSMSEIAIRCGRTKRDSAGNESGETSWLARRLGLLPEGGRPTPTPWIHSDVLALIAREGLGVCPNEVELQ